MSLGISAYVAGSKAEVVRELFIEQIRRFAREVLPALQAHRVTHVPLAEEAAA